MNPPKLKPIDFLPRSKDLNLSDETYTKAEDMLNKVPMEDISGLNPSGLAAGTIYMPAVLKEERKTEQEIADVMGITPTTVRNTYKKIAEYLDWEF